MSTSVGASWLDGSLLTDGANRCSSGYESQGTRGRCQLVLESVAEQGVASFGVRSGACELAGVSDCSLEGPFGVHRQRRGLLRGSRGRLAPHP